MWALFQLLYWYNETNDGCWSQVTTFLGGGELKAYADMAMVSATIHIPQTTLLSCYNKAKEEVNDKANNNVGDDIYAFDRTKINVQRIGLTTPEISLYYQSVSKARDERNRGIPMKEMIQLISEI